MLHCGAHRVHNAGDFSAGSERKRRPDLVFALNLQNVEKVKGCGAVADAHLGRTGLAPDTTTLAKQLLERAHVAVVAGEAFGAPGNLRISYATSIERIDEGLRRIERFLTAAVSAS